MSAPPTQERLSIMHIPPPMIVDTGDRQVTRSIVVNAPADELFALVANPHRHHELDGSGTVRNRAGGPERLHEGDRFTVHMRMYGVPYMITSTVTRAEPGKIVEWRHPAGHRWRYELEPLGPSGTRVTETFDYRDCKAARVYEMLTVPQKNSSGIERTLEKLARKYA
jgi:uncharacterized protein YndB with AHSA1/START domain